MSRRKSTHAEEAFGTPARTYQEREREFFIDNQLVRTHCIIVMIRWTSLAPWEFEFPFPGSLTSTFLAPGAKLRRCPEPPARTYHTVEYDPFTSQLCEGVVKFWL